MRTDELHIKLLEKNDQMAADIGEIKIILARQEESLRYHIHRTELAENAIDINRKHLDVSIQRLNKELEPIKKHVILINAVFKIIGMIGVGLTFLLGALKVILEFI